ncbi:GNAT family N-acetyltransferase [Clostridium weizhouense]|uniref:GNAT family N-acetyltransferase n=1 Tax=Clostridium weizhouense TaxID=2859781 RepID=A0ABS7ALX5_9CLOT|nr:GNAT family N-acetyltransferase [Clostridium weizhouense]MBW6409632.1 GNAT family N-acetyltransferase [Clostridium weizhouense]
MEFRKSVESDINSIINIIKKAQEYFGKKGIDQWQNNYPNIETIREDISNKNSYVLLKDNNIIGTAMLSFDGEKTYEYIYQGAWVSDNKYAVVHRIAIDDNYKGLGIAKLIIENIEKICLNKNIHSIRIDTHKDNVSMQKMLKKNGFKYCGIIYLEDKSERIAFEKTLINNLE